MSRIGRAPITIPKGVEVKVDRGELQITGPKGSLMVAISPRLTVEMKGATLTVRRPSDNRLDRAQHGLARTIINNAIIGVTQGFTKNLEIQGVGFRCAIKGGKLELSLGYSHPIVFEPPTGIAVQVPEPTKIAVSGIDKQLVGQVAANIRTFRPPDSYHGKGVRYQGEVVKLKPGKTVAR
ncbi:MAG: 50S ribosomal protein L6 [Truepera sp.]|nr:50S ribosomal protein L6 [Truepera sp.]